MNAEQVRSLVEAKAPESARLEFKRDVPTDGKEFSRDVCAMANADGGTIIFGIAEKKGCADSLVGVVTDDVDAEILRMTEILRAGIEPRLLRFVIDALQVESKHVLVLTVQQSMVRPHWVIAGGDRRFYVRHNSGKAPMSLDEIREAFVHSATVFERAADWRTRRVHTLVSDTNSPCNDADARLARHARLSSRCVLCVVPPFRSTIAVCQQRV